MSFTGSGRPCRRRGCGCWRLNRGRSSRAGGTPKLSLAVARNTPRKFVSQKSTYSFFTGARSFLSRTSRPDPSGWHYARRNFRLRRSLTTSIRSCPLAELGRRLHAMYEFHARHGIKPHAVRVGTTRTGALFGGASLIPNWRGLSPPSSIKSKPRLRVATLLECHFY